MKKPSICFNQKKQLENTSSAEEVDKKIERGEPARTDRAREPVFDTPPLPSPVGEEVPHVPHEHRGALQRREVPARARAREMFQVAPGGHPGTRRPEEFARHVEHRGGDADVAVEVALFFFWFLVWRGGKRPVRTNEGDRETKENVSREGKNPLSLPLSPPATPPAPRRRRSAPRRLSRRRPPPPPLPLTRRAAL